MDQDRGRALHSPSPLGTPNSVGSLPLPWHEAHMQCGWATGQPPTHPPSRALKHDGAICFIPGTPPPPWPALGRGSQATPLGFGTSCRLYLQLFSPIQASAPQTQSPLSRTFPRMPWSSLVKHNPLSSLAHPSPGGQSLPKIWMFRAHIGSQKCVLLKGCMLEHCMTETPLRPTL